MSKAQGVGPGKLPAVGEPRPQCCGVCVTHVRQEKEAGGTSRTDVLAVGRNLGCMLGAMEAIRGNEVRQCC